MLMLFLRKDEVGHVLIMALKSFQHSKMKMPGLFPPTKMLHRTQRHPAHFCPSNNLEYTARSPRRLCFLRQQSVTR